MLRQRQSNSRNRASRFQVESLEARLQLSGAAIAPIAHFEGTIGPGGQRAIVVDDRPQEFHAPASGRVLVSVAASPGIQVQTGLRPLAMRPRNHGILALRAGEQSLSVFGQPGTAYEVALGLAGDVNRDSRVDGVDLALIRSDIRARTGQGTPADVNGDGRVNRVDLALTRANLGAATSVEPLTITASVANPHFDASGLLIESKVSIVGQTAPGATVTLSYTSLRVTHSKTATADASGAFRINFTLDPGKSVLQLEARDAFGQHATTEVSVNRAPNPGDKARSRTATVTFHAGPDFTGNVTDFTFDYAQGADAPSITIATFRRDKLDLDDANPPTFPVKFRTGFSSPTDWWSLSLTVDGVPYETHQFKNGGFVNFNLDGNDDKSGVSFFLVRHDGGLAFRLESALNSATFNLVRAGQYR